MSAGGKRETAAEGLMFARGENILSLPRKFSLSPNHKCLVVSPVSDLIKSTLKAD